MKHIIIIFICIALVSSTGVFAQSSLSLNSDSSAEQPSEELINVDHLGRSTPQGTMKGALDAFSRSDFEQAVQYFNFQNIPKKNKAKKSQELTETFFKLLTKGGQLTPSAVLSTRPEGGLQDGLAANQEQVGSIKWKEQTLPVMLERIKDDTQNLEIWLISAETIEQMQKLPEIQEENLKTVVEKVVPEQLQVNKWRGAPVGHWLGIIFLLAAAYAASWFSTFILGFLAKKLWKNYSPKKHAKLIKLFLVPVSLVSTVAICVTAARSTGLSIIVREAFAVVNISILWVALFLFLWLLIDTLSSRSEENLRRRKNLAGLSVVLFLRRSVKFILTAVAVILILDTVGVNVSAGLAALGIGGLALALGAQKTIENLVGSLTVVFDQPVRVGDFCKVGDTLGTIESIGMRSTRIRTLDRTITTIPNGDFSSQVIDNYTHRDKFLFKTTLGLRYETSSDQMRYILTGLRSMLYSHPSVETKAKPVAARVRFLGYGSDSLNVQLFAYILVETYDDFLAVQEDLNLRIANIIEDSGSGFAFPSQTIYLAKDTGLSEDKSKEAEKAIQQQIKNNELKFPDFSEEQKETLISTLDYPPTGSVKSTQENKG